MSFNRETGEVIEALEPAQVVQRLDQMAGELENLAGRLDEIRQEFEPIQKDYDRHVEDYIVGLWDDYTKGEIKKWPGEDVRLALAHKEMDTALRGAYVRLKNDERHVLDAMGRAKEMIGAYRSILSAQKEGLV